jgi:apolipoprotein N-acyltransferase
LEHATVKPENDAASQLRRLRAIADADPDDLHARHRILALEAIRAQELVDQGQRAHALAAWGALAEEGERYHLLAPALRAHRAARALSPGAPGPRAAIGRVQRQRLRRAARDAGLAVASGILLLGASPPFDLWPLSLVTLVPLLVAVRRSTAGRAAMLGWLTGFTANIGGLDWCPALIQRFAHVGAGAAWSAVVGVCAYQAVVFALWTGASALLHRWLRLSWLVAAPLAIATFESAIPFVFPWYFAITAWRAWPLVQIAELGGPPAVSAQLVLINLLVLAGGGALRRRGWPGRDVRWAAVVVAAVVVLGLGRALQISAARREAPPLRVALVQPNFGIVSMDARKLQGDDYIQVLRRATEEAGAAGAELVVWPESAFPFLFDRDLEREYAASHPWQLRGRYRGALLFGALTHPFGEAYIYNSAVLVAPDGRIAGLYDKTRLLAFGEYIPLSQWFPAWAARLRAKMPDWPDIEPGGLPEALVDGKLRLLPLICYEDILPDGVSAFARRARANLLVTVANHAWFGASSAPRQALALATFRAVETRRDLVRSTNTGVSSIGDALGRVVREGELHDVPRDRPLPPEMLQADVRLLDGFALGPFTLPWFPRGCALALVVLGIRGFWQRRRQYALAPRASRSR